MSLYEEYTSFIANLPTCNFVGERQALAFLVRFFDEIPPVESNINALVFFVKKNLRNDTDCGRYSAPRRAPHVRAVLACVPSSLREKGDGTLWGMAARLAHNHAGTLWVKPFDD